MIHLEIFCIQKHRFFDVFVPQQWKTEMFREGLGRFVGVGSFGGVIFHVEGGRYLNEGETLQQQNVRTGDLCIPIFDGAGIKDRCEIVWQKDSSAYRKHKLRKHKESIS